MLHRLRRTGRKPGVFARVGCHRCSGAVEGRGESEVGAVCVGALAECAGGLAAERDQVAQQVLPHDDQALVHVGDSTTACTPRTPRIWTQNGPHPGMGAVLVVQPARAKLAGETVAGLRRATIDFRTASAAVIAAKAACSAKAVLVMSNQDAEA